MVIRLYNELRHGGFHPIPITDESLYDPPTDVEPKTRYTFTQILPGSKRSLLEISYLVLDRMLIPLGFVGFCTGIVTMSGIFKSNHVFNGLAHFIKGGIFFWYGILTLGRWLGCFSELGWAWNINPSVYPKIPSAEFVESFVIFLYGCSNVFLEHLTAWGQAWSAQDLEHVAISVMFFGGGLCGMFIESRWIKHLLETSVSSSTKQTSTSMNPLPALIILLLGILMGVHHQDSMISTMIHKQVSS
jgi:hypothetical protein